MAEQGYRVPEVTRIVGITYRQLDYWARTGMVKPSIQDAHGSGSQRLYSFQDLATLKIIKKLLDTGVSLQQVRKAIDTLRDLKEPPIGTTLVSDGSRIYWVDSPGEVVDLIKGGQGVFALAVDRVWTDLEGSLSKTGKKRGRRTAAAGGA
jgi:DNA-binding transcriptional MerR regulator